MDEKSLALVELGHALRARDYRFVAVTPETHRRVLARPAGPVGLRAGFGWNRTFARGDIETALFDLLARAEALEEAGGSYKSKVRFATIGDLLFVHSAFPTVEPDAVFFGPDTYRFVRVLRASLAGLSHASSRRLIDIGSGSGAGGIFASRLLGEGTELVLADINERALALGAVNAVLNGFPSAKSVLSDVLGGVEGEADLIIANPPYLVDEDRRVYRHGGGALGIALALRIVEEGLARLTPGGRLILYSGTPILGGADPLFQLLVPILQLQAAHYVYEEIDPDVFGEELEKPAYSDADRVAAICLTATKQG